MTGRNDLCPCGSGKKYKKCCLSKDEKTHTEWKKEISKEIPRHLLKHPCYVEQPEDGYNSKQDIINAYTSAGYVVDIEESEFEIDGELDHWLHVNLICPHGYSEHEEGFELLDGKWEGYESAEGNICSVCQIIRDHKVVPACPSCNTLLPVLPESERLRYYKEGIDYLSNTLCPKCGSGFLTQRLPWLPTA